MSAAALGLILAAAFIHAGWNYWLKKSGGGLAFVWLFASFSALLYLPPALYIILTTDFAPSAGQLGLVAVSAVLHSAYYLLLDRGYRRGDLSLVYPLARATGPLLRLIFSILLLGYRPSALGLAGALTVIGGAILLTGNPLHALREGQRHAVGYALIAGTMIAGYTVVDKVAVAAWLLPPLLLDWGANLGRVTILAPLALRDPAALQRAWHEQRKAILIVGALCPLSYILVLTAMAFTPVSYVAPAREISILVAAFMGTHWLAEAEGLRRMTAAGIMVAGIVALALA
jgi:drug/metabolite transporter (DMT)-like permease